MDRTKPEKYPDRFILGHCDVCARCYLDLRTSRCDCGGPFNAQHEYSRLSFVEVRT